MVPLLKVALLGFTLLSASARTPLISASPWAGQSAGPPGCDTPADRAFDFWIGRWAVTDSSDGTLAGENVIEAISGRCALLENWTSAAGHSGKSINYYDPSNGLWHQTWVGAGRSILNLSGSFENGVMELRGTSTERDGRQIVNRISWFDNADGSVRQWWETSSDGGDTWSTAFDLKYVKQP